MTPSDFIAKWGPGGSAAHLNEEQGAQSHFLDLCELLGVPKPGDAGAAGEYVFERRSLVLGEARGFADVFYRDHFAWENKAPGKNLDAALRQLQQYSLALSNPPLLVVCDRLTLRIHTQFNGHPSETHRVRVEDLAQPDSKPCCAACGWSPRAFTRARPTAASPRPPPRALPCWPSSCALAAMAPTRWRISSPNACSASLPKTWACCPGACSSAW